MAEVLPLLYLHGLSTKDFVPALTEFFGASSGPWAAAITRLTTNWPAEHEAFMARDLSEVDYVYVRADGIHFSVRLGSDDRLCVLVIVGVRTDGQKELVAISDGYRESTESWAELLHSLKRRGMRAPVLAVGDGALGFWLAIRDVIPETAHQRDWVHKAANGGVDRLGERGHPRLVGLEPGVDVRFEARRQPGVAKGCSDASQSWRLAAVGFADRGRLEQPRRHRVSDDALVERPACARETEQQALSPERRDQLARP